MSFFSTHNIQAENELLLLFFVFIYVWNKEYLLHAAWYRDI